MSEITPPPPPDPRWPVAPPPAVPPASGHGVPPASGHGVPPASGYSPPPAPGYAYPPPPAPGYAHPPQGYPVPPPGATAAPPGAQGHPAPPPGYAAPAYGATPYGAPRYGVPPYGVPPYGAPGFPPGAVPVARPVSAIGAATRILIAVVAALSLISIAVGAWGWSVVTDDFLSADFATISAYEGLDGVVSTLGSMSLTAAAICWLVWQHRVASSLHPSLLRRTPGWHVGSWFIPIVALWFPFQNVSDIVRGTRAPVSGGVLGSWWGLWVASALSPLLVNMIVPRVGAMSSLHSGIVLSIVSDVLLIAAAPFAWLIVQRITDALTPSAP